MYLLKYPDGTEQEVARCFLVETNTRKKGTVTKWITQRKPGGRLRKYLPEELLTVQFAPEGIPEAWRPSPRRSA